MRRRGFLAGLLALPFIQPIARAATAIKRKLFPAISVGEGGDVRTIAEAFEMIEPGGTIYILPGIHKIHGPIVPPDNASGWRVRGGNSGEGE